MNIKQSLRSQNRKWLINYFVFTIVVFYVFSGYTSFSHSDFSDLIDKIRSPNSIFTLMLIPLVIAFNGFLSSRMKERLIFWRLYNPMPGHRAFSEIAPTDPRIDFEALNILYPQGIPVTPKEQNIEWYKLYQQCYMESSVYESQRNYLLTRDLASLSFLFMPVLGVLHLIMHSSPLMALSNLVLYFVLMILFMMAARNYAHGFVANVIIEVMKRFGVYLKPSERGKEIDESIPVMVDDVKNLDSFQMTRCSYFSIECEEPSLDWTLTLRENEIPFLLVNLSGIIFSPIKGGKFDTIYKIRGLFETVESKPNLYIDTNDIWIPNFVFQGDVTRGQIYRMGYNFFKTAWLYRENKISEKEFNNVAEELSKHISFSKIETEVFKEFQTLIIQEAIEQYPKNKDFALTWKE